MGRLQKRLELHNILVSVLGSQFVYYQPPSNLQINYPCIIYKLSSDTTRFADNAPYMRRNRYTITVIDRDPDSSIVDRVSELPLTSFDRAFVSDNLNHTNFNIYF